MNVERASLETCEDVINIFIHVSTNEKDEIAWFLETHD